MERLNIYFPPRPHPPVDILFPPRSRLLPLKIPSRITEGVLYIRLFTYTAYARVVNGIAAGAALAGTFLEKTARGGSGITQGGEISTPSKIVSSRVRTGTAAGGKALSASEKKAAGHSGIRHGAAVTGEADRYAGAVMRGTLAGEYVGTPGLLKTAPLKGGAAHGGEVPALREVRAHGFAGAAHGGRVRGLREERAGALMSGVRAGCGIFGGARTVRLRKLSELDGLRLSELDGQGLGELDYIVIEE